MHTCSLRREAERVLAAVVLKKGLWKAELWGLQVGHFRGSHFFEMIETLRSVPNWTRSPWMEVNDGC